MADILCAVTREQGLFSLGRVWVVCAMGKVFSFVLW